MPGLREPTGDVAAAARICHDSFVRSSRKAPLVVTAAMAGLLSGCGSNADTAVRDASDHFHEAIGSQDGTSACALLAPRTRSEVAQAAGKACAQAILDEKIPSDGVPERITVVGPDAQVRYPEDAVFLSRYRGTWLVVAAGCTPAANDQYDCEVSGG